MTESPINLHSDIKSREHADAVLAAWRLALAQGNVFWRIFTPFAIAGMRTVLLRSVAEANRADVAWVRERAMKPGVVAQEIDERLCAEDGFGCIVDAEYFGHVQWDLLINTDGFGTVRHVPELPSTERLLGVCDPRHAHMVKYVLEPKHPKFEEPRVTVFSPWIPGKDDVGATYFKRLVEVDPVTSIDDSTPCLAVTFGPAQSSYGSSYEDSLRQMHKIEVVGLYPEEKP